MEISELEKKKVELNELLLNERLAASIYSDFRNLKNDFKDRFLFRAPNETINADFDTYESYIVGLASGGINSRLDDALERFRIRSWLEKSFFEWFPKYRFLEKYDLSQYEGIYQSIIVLDKLRHKLIELINTKEEGITCSLIIEEDGIG
ncbi:MULTISPECIES: YxiJ family protein [Paenibacillus]|uniref:Uncharacterized protein n=1 Tax=Paenibacillus albilobatus TaxID=2716884 RepID=A0A919XFS8_9BACL|nr:MULTISPECIES: YxiJ family protein [Paenibacillus]GIO31789.1 hypothetical protein J2TS6_29300 [Paenibacillus albilobatus]